jgi:hypothetical protein
MMSQDTFPGVRSGLVPWAGRDRRSGTDLARALGQALTAGVPVAGVPGVPAAVVLGAVVRASRQGPETFTESQMPPGRGAIIAASSSPATAKVTNQPIHEARGRSGGASQCLR